MKQVDYDAVAPMYDQRYRRNAYDECERVLREFAGASRSVLEVGCGTGHWLRALGEGVGHIVGVDRSFEMLRRARDLASSAVLVRGTAEQLPLRDAQFDRVFCMNALHHFGERAGFIAECRRVLRSGGRFLTIGLDPHNGNDQWWIYDYFPGAYAADLERYPSTSCIRDLLVSAGFGNARSDVVQHRPATRPYDEALASGLLERHATSQLMVITDAEYAAGRQRLANERPVLRADLRLFGTWAEVNA